MRKLRKVNKLEQMTLADYAIGVLKTSSRWQHYFCARLFPFSNVISF